MIIFAVLFHSLLVSTYSQSGSSYDEIKSIYDKYFEVAKYSINYFVLEKELTAKQFASIREGESFPICTQQITGENEYEKHQKRCDRKFLSFKRKESCQIVDNVNQKRVACQKVDEELVGVFKTVSVKTDEVQKNLELTKDEVAEQLKEAVTRFFGESASEERYQWLIKDEIKTFRMVALLILMNFTANLVIGQDYHRLWSYFIGDVSCEGKPLGIKQECLVKEGIEHYQNLAKTYRPARDKSLVSLEDAINTVYEGLEEKFKR